MSSLPFMPQVRAGGTLTLPRWRVLGPDGKKIALSSITAIAFTIQRIHAGTTVGAADRDGYGAGTGANGITLDTSSHEVVHQVAAADNALATAGASEQRRVIYTVTHSGGLKHVRTVDYWVMA